MDNEGKHVPDSLREIEQRLAHMRGNQSQIEQLVGQLSSRLDQISKNLELVNGSAEKLRQEISNTINEQMPSHFEKFNSSLVDVQTRVSLRPWKEHAPWGYFALFVAVETGHALD